MVAVGKPSARRLEGVQIDALLCHGSPQAFDEHVVHPAPFTIHADLHFGCPQNAGDGWLVNWLPLVMLGYPACHGLLQRLDAKGSVHGIGQ